MTIAAHTLGCKLNYAETSDLLRRLAEEGHTVVEWGSVADLYIVNTCTVTAVAEKKCRNAIRQAHRLNPDAQIVVMGCFAQVAASEIEKIPGVTLVLGNDRKALLPSMLPAVGGNLENLGKRFKEISQDFDRPDESWKSKNNLQDFQDLAKRETFALQYSSGDRTRTFFKIQDGCDYFCTYCAIPYARGHSRSASIEETLCAARRIADSGAKEVILTGVNTGTFGQHQGESFLELLEKLDKLDGILRYRISSIEPNLLTDDIIRFVASSRAFLPHFHIPLQAGSDHVLQLMHRRYDTALYAYKLQKIKSLMPDACIAADVMAGFNGETEEEFAKVLSFIDSLPISYLHVFTYSDRPGTAALRLGEKIPIPVRREHTARLLELSEKKHKKFINSQLGKTRPVLWESTQHYPSPTRIIPGDHSQLSPTRIIPEGHSQLSPFQGGVPEGEGGTMLGWTDNYIRLSHPYSPTLANTIQQVPITPDIIVNEA